MGCIWATVRAAPLPSRPEGYPLGAPRLSLSRWVCYGGPTQRWRSLGRGGECFCRSERSCPAQVQLQFILRKGPHQFLDQLRVLGPGRGEGRSFRKKNCGAQWRVPASCPWTLRAVPDWAPPGIPEAPAPTPVWIVRGCRSVAAAQLVRGSHSLGARKPSGCHAPL